MSTALTPPIGQVLVVDAVADLAAAVIDGFPAASLKEGQLVFVKSLRTYWRYAPLRALVSDGITVQNNTVAGQFLRDENYHDETWLSQSLWYIDGAAGDDENDGLTPATALLTWAELVRRLGQVYAAPNLGNMVEINVISQPVDQLQWEVVRKGAPSTNQGVVIKRQNAAAAGVINGFFALPGNAEIGQFTTPGAFLSPTKIVRFPLQGADVFACVSEIRAATDASLCSMVQRQGNTFFDVLSLALNEQVDSIDPGVCNITYLKSSPGALVLQECRLVGATLDGVAAIGCYLTACETTDLDARASVIEGGTHQGKHTAIATVHLEDAVLSGYSIIGSESAFSVLGSIVLKGPAILTTVAITQTTDATIEDTAQLFGSPSPGDSIFGGLVNALPAPAIGVITLAPGGVITTTDPASAKLEGPDNSLSFAQAAPFFIDTATGALAPGAFTNLTGDPLSPLYPTSAFRLGAGGGTLLERKSSAMVINTGV